jgi:hypothetical protein
MGASNPEDLCENCVMASLLLGIDIGTTAAKAVLVTPEGQVVSEGRSQYPTDHVAANWVEQNPEDWWRALCAATHEAMSKVTATKILGVAISSQAPTLLAGINFADVKAVGAPLAVFGILFPILSGSIGVLIGTSINLSVGGATMLGILSASASYIAAPAAVAVALPQASPTLALTSSIGITFPFNLILGIPLYLKLAQILG